MKDIKVTSIKTDLPISLPVQKVKDNPLTLSIRGSSLTKASYVFINDVPVNTFNIISNQEILVQIPAIIKQSEIKQIRVISDNPVINKKNLIHFDMDNTIKSLSGFQRLIQHFIKILLQDAGSNAFRPNEGGGLLKLIGKNTINNGVPITTDIIDGVNRAKNSIISRQNKIRNIPLNERLLNVSINGINFGKDKSTVELSLTLTNQAGTSLSTGILL